MIEMTNKKQLIKQRKELEEKFIRIINDDSISEYEKEYAKMLMNVVVEVDNLEKWINSITKELDR